MNQSQAELSTATICPQCHKGILLPRSIPDPVNDDLYTWGECNNLDCNYTEE